MKDTNRFTETEKKCGKCQIFKPFGDFFKSKRGSGGLHNHCKKCAKDNHYSWLEKNKEKVRERLNLPEVKKKINERRREKYRNDTTFREKELEKNRIRRKSESSRIKARDSQRKWYSLPQNKIACALRTRFHKVLKGLRQVDYTKNLVGCNFIELKLYLESKFQDGMTWDNYGAWHIDHIKPCASFDLTQPEQQRECFHYSNLQPLWAKDNMSKGAKII